MVLSKRVKLQTAETKQDKKLLLLGIPDSNTEKKNILKAGVFIRHSCKSVLYVYLYSDFTTCFQTTKSNACQSVLGLNSWINVSFVMLGMETSKELVKMLLVLLHDTIFSESPPEYFTKPGVTRLSSLARTSLQYPSIHTALQHPSIQKIYIHIFTYIHIYLFIYSQLT